MTIARKVTGPWTPCRRHLFALMATIAPSAQHRAVWQIADETWAAMKHDPNLNGDWWDGYPAGALPTLLGLRVQVVPALLTRVQIAIPVDCEPPA